MKTTAIILAAGEGKRMGMPINKVFLMVGGMPILERTLRLFDHHPLVHEIILVASANEIAMCDEIAKQAEINKLSAIIPGGSTRHASEFHGLKHIAPQILSNNIGIVIFHDAVRPFVRFAELTNVIEAAKIYGASVLAVPANHKVALKEQGDLIREHNYNELWMAQTPQAFEAKSVLHAHTLANEEGFIGTDTSSVMERYGYRVHLVEGSYINIKITTPEDLLWAEQLSSNFNPHSNAKMSGAHHA